MEERPITAFILSTLSGLFVLGGTIMGFVYLPGYATIYYSPYPSYYVPFLVTAGVCGALILVAGFFLYLRPSLHVAWGVMTLVLSVASAFAAVTGYYALFGVIGIVFGLVGGSLAVAWRPGGWPPPPASGYMRICQGCGRYVPMTLPFCGFCGTPASTLSHPGPRPPTPPSG